MVDQRPFASPVEHNLNQHNLPIPVHISRSRAQAQPESPKPPTSNRHMLTEHCDCGNGLSGVVGCGDKELIRKKWPVLQGKQLSTLVG